MLLGVAACICEFVCVCVCVCVCACFCTPLNVPEECESKNKSLLPRIYERAGLTIGRYQDECAHSSAGLWKRLVWLVRSTAGSIFGKGRKNAVHTTSQTNIDKRQIAFLVLFFIKTFLGAPFATITAYFTF